MARILTILLAICFCAAPGQAREHVPILPVLNMILMRTVSPAQPFSLSSTSFSDGGYLSSRYALGGSNISPQLSWNNPPGGTRYYRIKVYDLDATDATGQNWIHWLLEVPASVTSLAENAGAAGGANLPAGSIRYSNSFFGQGNQAAAGTDYDGPDPPSGEPHRYRFSVTPLDINKNPLCSPAYLEAKYTKFTPPPAP